MGVLSDEELASLRSEVALIADQHRYCDTEWAQGVIEELIASHMALAARVEERRDWTGEEIEEAVWRLREAAAEDATGVMVRVEDLRMLLASADGLADNYSILLEHTTGLTKPTTDARRILSLVDDRERERQDEAIAEAREDWAGLQGEG